MQELQHAPCPAPCYAWLAVNLKQKIVVWVGLAVIVAMGVRPPVSYVRTTLHEGGHDVEYFAGYAWIFKAGELFHPEGKSFFFTYHHLDVARLLVQWAMVAIVALGLVWTLGDKRRAASPQEQESQG